MACSRPAPPPRSRCPSWPADTSPAESTAHKAGIIIGGGVAIALAAALGVAVGTVVRNQVGAIIAVLSILYVAEPLLGLVPHAGTAVETYGLGGLASGATGTTGFPASAHLLG